MDKEAQEKIYPCDDCGMPRSEAEGGTIFTLCDKCWDKRYRKPPKGKPPLLSDEGIYDADMSAVTAYIKEHSGKDSWDGSECEMSGRRAIAQAQWDIWNKAIYG